MIRHKIRSGVASRRQFLLGTSALTGAAWAAQYARLLHAHPAPLETVRLSDRMLAVIGPNANVLVGDSDEGIIMVDGGDEAWSDALLRTVDEQFPSRPIRALFNTHWHSEHVGSNLPFGEQGVEIIAHENTKLWLGTEVWVRWSDIIYPPRPPAALPTTTFYESTTIRLADRHLDCGYMPKAHTDGDIWVFFPEENVLAAGGPVSNDGWPVIDWWTGGWTSGMLDGFESLLELVNEETRIVPGRGPLMSVADLRAQYEMYRVVFARIHEMLRGAYGTDEVLAARPTAEFDEIMGDPELFVILAFQSIWGHLRDAYDTRERTGA